MLRPEVEAFAQAMERELRANDHKPGWKTDDAVALVDRLFDEAGELQNEIDCASTNKEYPGEREKILKEAADVANFAMMIADVCGALALDAKERT